jgi:hypothetical protein
MTMTNTLAVREQVPTVLVNLGSSSPENLVLVLTDMTNGIAALCTNWTTSGATAVAQGTVGTSGADINFNTVSFVAAATVAVSSLVFTAGNA